MIPKRNWLEKFFFEVWVKLAERRISRIENSDRRIAVVNIYMEARNKRVNIL